jgi:hypothetical protein
VLELIADVEQALPYGDERVSCSGGCSFVAMLERHLV